MIVILVVLPCFFSFWSLRLEIHFLPLFITFSDSFYQFYLIKFIFLVLFITNICVFCYILCLINVGMQCFSALLFFVAHIYITWKIWFYNCFVWMLDSFLLFMIMWRVFLVRWHTRFSEWCCTIINTMRWKFFYKWGTLWEKLGLFSDPLMPSASAPCFLVFFHDHTTSRHFFFQSISLS